MHYLTVPDPDAVGGSWRPSKRASNHGLRTLGYLVRARRVRKFEKGSSLAGYQGYSHADEPLTDEDSATVEHNPRRACCERPLHPGLRLDRYRMMH